MSLQPSVTICLFRAGPFSAEYDFCPVDLYIMNPGCVHACIHAKKVGYGVQAPELCCQEQQQPLVYFSELAYLRQWTPCWFCYVEVQVTRGTKLKSVRYYHNNLNSKYNVVPDRVTRSSIQQLYIAYYSHSSRYNPVASNIFHVSIESQYKLKLESRTTYHGEELLSIIGVGSVQ